MIEVRKNGFSFTSMYKNIDIASIKFNTKWSTCNFLLVVPLNHLHQLRYVGVKWFVFMFTNLYQ